MAEGGGSTQLEIEAEVVEDILVSVTPLPLLLGEAVVHLSLLVNEMVDLELH